MQIVEWAKDRAERLTIWDVGLLKVTSMLFGILVGAYVAPWVSRNVVWLAAALFVFGGTAAYRWFSAKPPRPYTLTSG
jgi:putative Mn2+ efflux pump MntP